MVEDRVTDGGRIAQLLASELSGRDGGGLSAVSVVDADPDAEPAPGGTLAYRVAVRGDRVGAVVVYPDEAVVAARPGPEADAGDDANPGSVVDVAASARDAGLRVQRDGETARLHVESGAAVKRAVDALVAGLADARPDDSRR
jgi:hypothetical protein